jgi:hypothetical protein
MMGDALVLTSRDPRPWQGDVDAIAAAHDVTFVDGDTRWTDDGRRAVAAALEALSADERRLVRGLTALRMHADPPASASYEVPRHLMRFFDRALPSCGAFEFVDGRTAPIGTGTVIHEFGHAVGFAESADNVACRAAYEAERQDLFARLHRSAPPTHTHRHAQDADRALPAVTPDESAGLALGLPGSIPETYCATLAQLQPQSLSDLSAQLGGDGPAPVARFVDQLGGDERCWWHLNLQHCGTTDPATDPSSPVPDAERAALHARYQHVTAAIARFDDFDLHDVYAEVPGAIPGPTAYAAESRIESFAESFELFHTDPESLAAMLPEVYAWFEARHHLQGVAPVACDARPPSYER